MTYKVICLYFCLRKTDKKCNCNFFYVLIILCYYKTYSIVLLWTTPITDTLWHLSELIYGAFFKLPRVFRLPP